jgi:hypothetical protein
LVNVPFLGKLIQLANIVAALRVLRDGLVQAIEVELAFDEVAAHDQSEARRIWDDIASRLPTAGKRCAGRAREVAACVRARHPNLNFRTIGLSLNHLVERRRRCRSRRGVRLAELELMSRRVWLWVGMAATSLEDQPDKGDAEDEIVQQTHRQSG